MVLHHHEDGTPYVIMGGHKVQLEREPFTEKELIEKAKIELRETPENVEKGLRELRELLKKESNLVVPMEDDDFLIQFLRPCKFYAESAFKKMQAYYKFRLSYPDYCNNLTPRQVKPPFVHSIVSILSPRDQHGRRIMHVESGKRWNVQDVKLSEMFRGVQIGLESAMAEPRTQVCGVNVVLNMEGLSFSQVMQFTPSFAKMVVDWIQCKVYCEKYLCYLSHLTFRELYFELQLLGAEAEKRIIWVKIKEDCIPVRLKGVHIVNQPFIFNMLFAIFRPFLSEKLRARIHFHGADKSSLLKHIDGGSLKERLGGTLPDDEITGDDMWRMLCYYEEKFVAKNSHGYVNNNNKK